MVVPVNTAPTTPSTMTDVENSEHIDAQRTRQNVYWDCYRGVTTSANQGKNADKDFSFEDIERMYYASKYGDFVDAQNERNEKARYPERNRTVEDLLKNKKTCPEESIYQIGTLEDHVSGDVLLAIANDFFGEMDCQLLRKKKDLLLKVQANEVDWKRPFPHDEYLEWIDE